MTYKNVKDVLVDAAKFPAAIEAKLPTGAPTLSATLIDVAGKFPVVPDFPMEIPALPAPPELPAFELPEFPGALGKRYVTGVEVTPIPSPAPAPQIQEKVAKPVTAEIVS